MTKQLALVHRLLHPFIGAKKPAYYDEMTKIKI